MQNVFKVKETLTNLFKVLKNYINKFLNFETKTLKALFAMNLYTTALSVFCRYLLLSYYKGYIINILF